jgi:hypothetical protein
MGFVFTWLRMSSSKILTWARRSNYQSKDIAWMQKVTSERMTEKVGRGCCRCMSLCLVCRQSLCGLRIMLCMWWWFKIIIHAA